MSRKGHSSDPTGMYTVGGTLVSAEEAKDGGGYGQND